MVKSDGDVIDAVVTRPLDVSVPVVIRPDELRDNTLAAPEAEMLLQVRVVPVIAPLDDNEPVVIWPDN
eukprot:51135-Eustigmatos_ZCMA.PRE.1